jgi:hypothetical protein
MLVLTVFVKPDKSAACILRLVRYRRGTESDTLLD